METQEIANLLGDADNEPSEFVTKKWYVINDQTNTSLSWRKLKWYNR